MVIEVYWTDEDGHRWRVTDAAPETKRGKRVAVPMQIGEPMARWRLFTREDARVRRVYTFGDEQHAIGEATLRRQFLASEPVRREGSRSAAPSERCPVESLHRTPIVRQRVTLTRESTEFSGVAEQHPSGIQPGSSHRWSLFGAYRGGKNR